MLFTSCWTLAAAEKHRGMNYACDYDRTGTKDIRYHAVTGAKVCVAADMPSMEHPGLTTVAKEGSGGRYETLVKFGMGGSWKAGVTIAEPGKPLEREAEQTLLEHYGVGASAVGRGADLAERDASAVTARPA